MSASMYGVKENDDPKFLNRHNDYPLYFRPNHKYRSKEGNILDREKMQLCLSLTPLLGSETCEKPVGYTVRSTFESRISEKGCWSVSVCQRVEQPHSRFASLVPERAVSDADSTLRYILHYAVGPQNPEFARENNSRARFLPRSTCRNRLVRASPEEQAFGRESVGGLERDHSIWRDTPAKSLNQR